MNSGNFHTIAKTKIVIRIAINLHIDKLSNIVNISLIKLKIDVESPTDISAPVLVRNGKIKTPKVRTFRGFVFVVIFWGIRYNSTSCVSTPCEIIREPVRMRP